MMLMNMDGSDDEAEEDHAQTEKKNAIIVNHSSAKSSDTADSASWFINFIMMTKGHTNSNSSSASLPVTGSNVACGDTPGSAMARLWRHHLWQLFEEHGAIDGVWEFKKKRVISFVDAGSCSIYHVVEYIILIYYVYLHYVQDTKSASHTCLQ